MVAGVGDTDGYHLFIARGSEGWRWEPLAVLAPGGGSAERWIGRQCLTGDGRTVVAVIAPWHVVNSPEGNDRGGTAIAVDMVNHRARVLATGVSLSYFNPGCGAASDVALTRYLGHDERTTQLLRVNAETRAVDQSVTVPGEVTSAIPVRGSLLAARGGRLVRLAGRSESILITLPGQAFDLRPNLAGGADLLTTGARATATAWRWAAGRLSRLGQGSLGGAGLASVRGARTVLFGVAAAPARGLAVYRRPVPRQIGTSMFGTAVLSEPPKTVRGGSWMLPAIRTATGALIRRAAVPPAVLMNRFTAATPAHRAAAMPTSRPAGGGGHHPFTAADSVTTPTCAVPRDSLQFQVPQPSNDQVNWAVQQAVMNALPARPAGFDNLHGGTYNPGNDFPQPTLTGGAAGAHVPQLIVDGVLAQESNWDQASWHAGPGLSGDPLIADYYGGGGDLASIDYSNSDCGYGIGQITDIMRAGAYDPTVQQRVAVDYAENIAATVQHLAATWNQLAAYSPPLTVNGADPSWLENWYMTVWAYNSGVQPRSGAFGLPSGCTVAGPPNCTDSAGNWGLGWSNNPINPIYPPGRGVFLQTSYADAAHPGDWPYQERVFGWIATPLLRYDAQAGRDVPAYTPSTGYLQQPLSSVFCSTSVNNCNPNDPAGNYCLYQDPGPLQYHCWWHGPIGVAGGCDSQCQADAPLSAPGQPEPTAANPDPPVCNLDTSQVPLSTPAGSTIIVSEEATPENTGNQDINVVGCPQAGGRNWASNGTFTLQYATDSNGNPVGQIDLHQLGVGFGGHIWFTHTSPPGGAMYYQVTGTWKPNISALGNYQVKVFIPDLGAVATPATYTITTAAGTTVTRAINQADYNNQWVSLGDFALSSNAAVALSNITANGDYSSDLAFNALAFIPRPGTLIHHTVDAFSNFSQTQSLDTTPPSSWIAGDFAGDSSLTARATSLINGILGAPACTGSNAASCTGPALRAQMSAWQQQVSASGGHPVQWLGFSHPRPPNPLPPGYLDDGTNFKVRASVNVDYMVVDGAIDPNSYSVTATNQTGITHVPGFITGTFNAIASDYGTLPPDLSYSATNLQFFNGQNTSWDPWLDNRAPGREYMPDLSVQLTDNNTCLQVQDIAGGAIGWKTIVTDPNIPGRIQAWDNNVHTLVTAGQAPQAVANLADMITKDFFTPTLSWQNPPPWVQDGTIFEFAPPIWVESHFKYCADGSLHPAGSVDPVTGKAQLADSSYMPDLYLAIDGTDVGKYGNPTNGAPLQTGDWADFSVSPLSGPPNPSPWNPCYIGPTDPVSGTSFIDRRDGQPWDLAVLNATGLSTTVSFC